MSLTITEHDGVDSPLYEIEGTVNGEPNSTPDDYAFITIEGYDYHHSGSDAGVDVDISIY